MAFSFNTSQQISIFDATSSLTQREKKMLDKSWAKFFAEELFPAIDEAPFKVLYSDRPSRYNTPVNIIIGALILKEVHGLTDEEIVEELPFDIRFKYALHTTSFEEQPLNNRTLGRFRARCHAYAQATGIDLIHDCIVKLSSLMAELMNLNSGLRRMDSLMVASNIKKMSRLELLYTCVANLCRLMVKLKDTKLPESMKHYTEDDDRNIVLYHNRSEDTDSKIRSVLDDASVLISACGSEYDDCSEYQLLIRVINEQTTTDENGVINLKKKASGMGSDILQNPADPDATFVKKAGKEHIGYIANVVETSDSEKSIVTEYQFEQNKYSDSKFLKDYIEQLPDNADPSILTTDGGYCGNENSKLAAAKKVTLVTTDLKGSEVDDIWADFEFNADGTKVLKCAAGNVPKSNVYNKCDQKCKVSFPINTCKSCPLFERCKPKLYKRVASLKVAQRTKHHASQQRFLKTDDFKKLAKYRNGVETIPAALRKRHDVDHMPVRGLLRCRIFFGFKVAALNVRKFVRYMAGLDKCASNPALA